MSRIMKRACVALTCGTMFQIVGCLPGNYPGGFSVLPGAGNPALYAGGIFNPFPGLPGIPGFPPIGGEICPLQLIPDVPLLDDLLGWSTNIKPQICNTVGGIIGVIPGLPNPPTDPGGGSGNVLEALWSCVSGC